MNAKDKIRAELKEVRAGLAEVFLRELSKKQPEMLEQVKGKVTLKTGPIHESYQVAYTRALGLIRSLMPERLPEFVGCYEPDPKRKETDWLSYTIKDYLLGLVIKRLGDPTFDTFSAFSAKIQHQISIMDAFIETFADRIADAEAVLQASLFQAELDTAEELLKKSHLRAAGAVAGVVLERHLKSVSVSRQVKCGKKAPAISDLNEALKAAKVIDTPTWRLVQRLGDIRNLCVHSKDREPRKDEVQDLIIGARKVTGELT